MILVTQIAVGGSALEKEKERDKTLFFLSFGIATEAQRFYSKEAKSGDAIMYILIDPHCASKLEKSHTAAFFFWSSLVDAGPLTILEHLFNTDAPLISYWCIFQQKDGVEHKQHDYRDAAE